MARVTVYSSASCAFCGKAKALLDKWQIEFTEVRIDNDDTARQEFEQVTNAARTVPQIVIDGKPIGVSFSGVEVLVAVVVNVPNFVYEHVV